MEKEKLEIEKQKMELENQKLRGGIKRGINLVRGDSLDDDHDETKYKTDFF